MISRVNGWFNKFEDLIKLRISLINKIKSLMEEISKFGVD